MKFLAAIITVFLLHFGTVYAFEPVRSTSSTIDGIVTSITNRKPAPVSVVQFSSPGSHKPRHYPVQGAEAAVQRHTALQPSPVSQKKNSGPVSAPKKTASHIIAPAAYHPRGSDPSAAEPRGRAKASRPSLAVPKRAVGANPAVRAKALFCLDCASNKVVLAQNISEPLPIASITKLLTAMTVIEEMNLERVLEVPSDIVEVERHKVGVRPGDLFTVRDLLHGMLIESGNDCAEVLARAYPKGGRDGFITAMNRRAAQLGASRTTLFTPSGLDMKMTLGRKEGRNLDVRLPNTATAEDVATIAKHAFKNPLIAGISSMKTHTMRTHNTVPRDYPLVSNDRLLTKNLPIAGAKTGFTNMAGKCIVALFKDEKAEHMVVVLNTAQHFRAAEKIYRWANRMF